MKKMKITTKISKDKRVKKFVSIATIAFLFSSTMMSPLAPLAKVGATTASAQLSGQIIADFHFVITADFKVSLISNCDSNVLNLQTGEGSTTLGQQHVVDSNSMHLQGVVMHPQDNKPIIVKQNPQGPILKPSIVTVEQFAQVLAPQVQQQGAKLSISEITKLIETGLNTGTIQINSNMDLIKIIEEIVSQINNNVTNLVINIFNCGGEKTTTNIIKGEEGDFVIEHQNVQKPVQEPGKVTTEFESTNNGTNQSNNQQRPPVRTLNTNGGTTVVGEQGPTSDVFGEGFKPVVEPGKVTTEFESTNNGTNQTNNQQRPPVRTLNTNGGTTVVGEQGPTSDVFGEGFKPVVGKPNVENILQQSGGHGVTGEMGPNLSLNGGNVKPVQEPGKVDTELEYLTFQKPTVTGQEHVITLTEVNNPRLILELITEQLHKEFPNLTIQQLTTFVESELTNGNIKLEFGQNLSLVIDQIIKLISSSHLVESVNGTHITSQQLTNTNELINLITNEIMKSQVDLNREEVRFYVYQLLLGKTITINSGDALSTIVNQILTLIKNDPVINGIKVTQESINEQNVLVKFLATQVLDNGVKFSLTDIEKFITNSIENGSFKITEGEKVNTIIDQIVTMMTKPAFNINSLNTQQNLNTHTISTLQLSNLNVFIQTLVDDLIKTHSNLTRQEITFFISMLINNEIVNIIPGMNYETLIKLLDSYITNGVTINGNHVTTSSFNGITFTTGELNNLEYTMHFIATQVSNQTTNLTFEQILKFIQMGVENGTLQLKPGTEVNSFILLVINQIKNININSSTVLNEQLLENMNAIISSLATEVYNYGVDLSQSQILAFIKNGISEGSIQIKPNMSIMEIVRLIVSLIETNTQTHEQTFGPLITAQNLTNMNSLIHHLTQQVLANGLNMSENEIKNYILDSINNKTLELKIGMDIEVVVEQIVSQLKQGNVEIIINIFTCNNWLENNRLTDNWFDNSFNSGTSFEWTAEHHNTGNHLNLWSEVHHNDHHGNNHHNNWFDNCK